MTVSLDSFRSWLQHRAETQTFFSGSFWFIFSNQPEPAFIRTLGLQAVPESIVPQAGLSRTVTVLKRTGSTVQATFYYLPLGRGDVHVLFSLDKPAKALRPMYRLLARTGGKVHLFPVGHPIVKACVRLVPRFSFDETRVLRGVSYPSRPNEGGADINLRPGSASAFFSRLEEEKRVLKTARLRAPTSSSAFCEFTLGRPGYLTYHKGDLVPLLGLINEKLIATLAESVRPFEKAAGRFVEFRFPQPLFIERANYAVVIDALARLPRTSMALLHTNPYFHAALVNYEDGSEFDIFITGHSTIHIQGREDASPASFLRIHNGLSEQFQDAEISVEDSPQYTLRQLLEGQV